MLVLGIETSCDETGLALYDSRFSGRAGLLAQVLHSQVAMHSAYGGVVPELASRDHIRRLLPLCQQVLAQAKKTKVDIDAIAYTQGPGLAGALLTGAAFANSLALALSVPVIGIHHLEGHLLSPLLSACPPTFPFIALLVSGGHTQLMRVDNLGHYLLLGETLDDAAGECLDKTAKLLGLAYPGGPAISALAQQGRPGRFVLPRPMLHAGHLNFSFAGLKTAVWSQLKQLGPSLTEQVRADLAYECLGAVVEVLVKKSLAALAHTGLKRLVVAGGVGANTQLRSALTPAVKAFGCQVFYPELDLCTDNGAMIAYAGALHFMASPQKAGGNYAYTVHPRWALGINSTP
jgi:N6-L-threonylcarbamoyladenine synthase